MVFDLNNHRLKTCMTIDHVFQSYISNYISCLIFRIKDYMYNISNEAVQLLLKEYLHVSYSIYCTLYILHIKNLKISLKSD